MTRITVAALLALAILPSPRRQQSAPLAIGETFTLESAILKETRRINVYKPPVSSAEAGARLPVLYMPDGGIAEDFLHVAGLVQVSVGNGTMRPFLVVGIENTERRRDMTGPTEVADDRKIAPRVGESLAGLFVVETLLHEPELFDTYMAFDASLWWNAQHLVKTAPERLVAMTARPLRLFLASSREPELAKLSAAFAGVLRQHAPKALRWDYLPMPEETHATIYHPAALAAFREVLRMP